MNVTQMLEEVGRRVPDGASAGTRWRSACTVVVPGEPGEVTHEVAAAARIDAQGRRREQFWCDGLRVERSVLLRLTCVEVECPHAVLVREQWTTFRRVGAGTRSTTPPRPLPAEVDVDLGPQRFTARRARFPCFTPCPNGAHPPLTIQKSGFDLFEGGQCLGGGITESRGVRRPRLPTLLAAEAYVLARQLEAKVLMAAASGALRGGREAGGGKG